MSPSHSKRALLIGINRYPNLSTFAQLEGCVNDARLVAGLLRSSFGFPAEDVTVLTDEAATRDGILAAMETIVAAAGENDVVVMFYAGHGSQMSDREGDEPDGLDETIVPYDTGRPGLHSADGEDHENRDITDDEIHAWLLRLTEKTPYVTLLFDCCHSGTIARDDFGAKARFLEPDTRPASELPASPIERVVTRGVAEAAGPSGWLPLSHRYVLVAGCRDDESSYEYRDPENDTPHGALTFFLARALTKASPGTTYRDVYERVRPHVTAHSSKQHPQMEGALDRELFGVRDIEPMRFAGVEARDGNGITLGAGAAHGLTVGSEWEVYPPGTKTVEGASALGRVRITQVGAVASEADIIAEQEDGGIEPGARAVEAAHAFGEAGFRIQLHVPDGDEEAQQALVEELQRTKLLRIVEESEPADARAYLLPARTAISAADPVPQLGRIATPTWAVVGTDGRLLMPVHAASESGVARTLRDNFDKIVRYRQALALDNPDPHSDLRGTLEVRLLQQHDDAWKEAEPEDAGGEIVFEEGERIAFQITNNHTAPVYVYALDFGLSGAINLLTMRGANEALSPGNTLEVGTPKGIPLAFPNNFPFVQDPADPAPFEGTETLKVIATTEPADFSALEQNAMRSASNTALNRLLHHTFGGEPMRDLVFEDEEDDGDWIAVTRTFVLRRKATGTALDAAGGDVKLGTITLRTRGLDGEARVLPPAAFSARTRSAEGTTDALTAVLAGEHVGTQQSFEIQGARTRSLAAAEPTIELEVPDPGPEAGQFVLYTDESGVTTWQFAEPGGQRTRSLGPSTRRYVIHHAAPATPEGAATRGLVSAVGKKLIKVLVFPLIDPLIGQVSETFAERWEAKKRPYGLRPFTPADYRAPDTPALGTDDWRRLGAGRSLLFVHGTFSRAHSAFGGLSADTLTELHRRYGGRVFAFDHFTLSHDPRRNVEWLLAHLPDDASLDLDIVCHSRGGLVSRMLAEKQSAFSLGARSLRVGSVVFVASPNAGTHLADPEHMGTLVDTYTNLLNFIPDNPVTDVLDGVVTVAKQLAVGALGGLGGLQSMRPGGAFQQWLNAQNGHGDTAYFALGADFTPSQHGFREWVKDRLMDGVFGAENDLVVPTAGVYEANGSGFFPIEERHVFPADAAISHTGFFQHADAQAKLLAWLRPEPVLT